MAIDQSYINITGRLQEIPDSQSQQRQASSRAALAMKKRRLRNKTVQPLDPFRYGYPNPLGCHPCVGLRDKHADQIKDPSSDKRLQFSQTTDPSTGSPRMRRRRAACTHGDDLTVVPPPCDFSPKPVRVDSLESLYAFFERNSLVRALDTTPASTPDRTSVNYSLPFRQTLEPVQYDRDTSLEDLMGGHEANITRGNRLKEAFSDTDSLVPASLRFKDMTGLTSSQNVAEVKYSPNSGLPRGWTVNHDRFIAYLDTHTPLSKEGAVPRREWELPRYTIEEMIDLLKERFKNLAGTSIPTWSIQRRLKILDQRDNNHFNMPYGAYMHESWGQGI